MADRHPRLSPRERAARRRAHTGEGACPPLAWTASLSSIHAPNPRRLLGGERVADFRGGLGLTRIALAEEDGSGRVAGEQRADNGSQHRLLAAGEAAGDLVA